MSTQNALVIRWAFGLKQGQFCVTVHKTIPLHVTTLSSCVNAMTTIFLLSLKAQSYTFLHTHTHTHTQSPSLSLSQILPEIQRSRVRNHTSNKRTLLNSHLSLCSSPPSPSFLIPFSPSLILSFNHSIRMWKLKGRFTILMLDLAASISRFAKIQHPQQKFFDQT